MGRFINADIFASTGQGVLGSNMFAYCCNNPLLHEDSSGKSAAIAGGIVGGGFGFLGAVISECTDDNEGIRWDKVWKCTLSSAVSGAAAGFVADVSIASFGTVPAMFIAAGGGAIASGANSYYTQKTLSGEANWAKTASDTILGGITNGLCTATSSQLTPMVNGIKEGISYTCTQIKTELAYGLNSFGNFLVNDLLPTVITGFGAWYGAMEYDYLAR